MREQITSFPGVVGDAVVDLIGDAGRAIKSGPDSKVMAVLRTVVILSVAKGFQFSIWHTAVELAVKKCVAERHIADDLATRTIDLPAFIVPVAKFVKNKIEKRSLSRLR